MKMKKEIQNIYIKICVKIGIYTNVDNFLLTPEIFDLIIFHIVNESENFSSEQERKLNGTEKRNLGFTLINILLNDLLRKEKVDFETYNKFSSLDTDLFVEAKKRWRNTNVEKAASCCIC